MSAQQAEASESIPNHVTPRQLISAVIIVVGLLVVVVKLWGVLDAPVPPQNNPSPVATFPVSGNP